MRIFAEKKGHKATKALRSIKRKRMSNNRTRNFEGLGCRGINLMQFFFGMKEKNCSTINVQFSSEGKEN
jgi:hypothetical protein